MEAKLIIALDINKGLYRTLKTMELKELDKYMIEHYQSSEDVREDPELKEKIESFLASNEKWINTYQARTGKKNNGSINVICTLESGFIQHLMAFYRPNKGKLLTRQVKKEISDRLQKNTTLLQYALHDFREYIRFDDYGSMTSGIRRNSPTRIKMALTQWLRALESTQESYYNFRVLDRYTEKYVNDPKHERPYKVPLQTSGKKVLLPEEPVVMNTKAGTINIHQMESDQYILNKTLQGIGSDLDEANLPFIPCDMDELYSVTDLDDLTPKTR